MKEIILYSAIGFVVGIGYLRISEPEEFNARFPVFATEIADKENVINVNVLPQDRDRINQTITSDRQNAITNAIDKVYPSVVGINVKSVQQVQSRNMFDLFYGRRSRNVISQSIGSGFIISDDGYIITNQHVIDKAREISVILSNGERYEALKVGEDVQTDIALIKIVNTDQTFVPVALGNSEEIIIGEWAIALGNPFGLNQYNNNPTVTLGIISAKGRDFGHIEGEQKVYYNMIQTDAAINSGNSGGPLVNAVGEVIGMNTFIYSGGNQSSGNVGIAFAIPMNDIRKMVNFLKDGDIDRNFDIGIVRGLSNNKQYAYHFGHSVDYGVIVERIQPNSPAHQVGIRPGDVIIELNGIKIENVNKYREALFYSGLKVGDKSEIKVIRESKELIFNVNLESINK